MTEDRDRAAWLVPVAHPEASATLYVFPPGGSGAAAVRAFAASAPPDLRVVAVRLPGREALAHLEPLVDVDVIAADVTARIEADSLGRPPAVLYGHCAGAIVGYEVCGLLPAPTVAALVVSSHEAPDHIPVSMAWTWPEEEFLQRVADDGFIPDELVANEELRQLVLPALRADYEAIETHVSSLPELVCPVFAVLGEDDKAVSAEDVSAWRHRTVSSFRLDRIPGGHNLMADQAHALMHTIEAARHPRDTWGRPVGPDGGAE